MVGWVPTPPALCPAHGSVQSHQVPSVLWCLQHTVDLRAAWGPTGDTAVQDSQLASGGVEPHFQQAAETL